MALGRLPLSFAFHGVWRTPGQVIDACAFDDAVPQLSSNNVTHLYVQTVIHVNDIRCFPIYAINQGQSSNYI